MKLNYNSVGYFVYFFTLSCLAAYRITCSFYAYLDKIQKRTSAFCDCHYAIIYLQLPPNRVRKMETHRTGGHVQQCKM